MSAITSEWTPSETEAPTRHSLTGGRKLRREEEFRGALDAYIADYADYQKRRNETTGAGIRAPSVHHWFFGRLTEWFRHPAAVRDQAGRPQATARSRPHLGKASETESTRQLLLFPAAVEGLVPLSRR